MIFKVVTGALLAVSTLGLGSAAFAHHSFAMFDTNKSVVLDGTVKDFQWTNPHSWIQLTAMDQGKSVEFSIEGGSPNLLTRKGWTRTSLKIGDQVKITVHPLKDGTHGGSFMSAVLSDGRTLAND